MRDRMKNETLFDSQNAAYAQAMFEEYARNPDAVPAEWRQVFKDGGARALAEGLIAPEQLDGFRARANSTPAARLETARPPQPTLPSRQAPSAAPIRATPTSAPPPTSAEAAAAATDNAALAQQLRRVLPVVSRATALVQAFREHGHQLARLDPHVRLAFA